MNENVAVPGRQRKNPRYRMRVIDHAARKAPRADIVYSDNADEVVNCAQSDAIIGESPG